MRSVKVSIHGVEKWKVKSIADIGNMCVRVCVRVCLCVRACVNAAYFNMYKSVYIFVYCTELYILKYTNGC